MSATVRDVFGLHDQTVRDVFGSIRQRSNRITPELKQAFRWKAETLPAKYKQGSVSYYQAFEVALIGGLMFAAATFFLQEAFFAISIFNWIISSVFGVLTITNQLIIYKRALK